MITAVANWFDSDALIRAAETEDQFGTVLRMHLMVEAILVHYLACRITGELASCVDIPSRTVGKIGLAAAFGFPLPFVRAMRAINSIRNKLAHEGAPLTSDRVSELGRRVDDIKDINPDFAPLAKRYLTLTRVRPNERIAFGTGHLREDFLIASTILAGEMGRWMASHG